MGKTNKEKIMELYDDYIKNAKLNGAPEEWLTPEYFAEFAIAKTIRAELW
jgi:hypothetical protein